MSFTYLLQGIFKSTYDSDFDYPTKLKEEMNNNKNTNVTDYKMLDAQLGGKSTKDILIYIIQKLESIENDIRDLKKK